MANWETFDDWACIGVGFLGFFKIELGFDLAGQFVN